MIETLLASISFNKGRGNNLKATILKLKRGVVIVSQRRQPTEEIRVAAQYAAFKF